MYIGLVSDTHGVWSPEFEEFLAPCDVLWHAGDWGGDASFAGRISSFKTVVGVHGNCDGRDIRLLYPRNQFFDCEGASVLMTHIGGYPGRFDPQAKALIESLHPRIFVCGHSHILKVMYDEQHGMLCINPGAAGRQGWHVVRTALRFRIEGGEVKDMEVFNLPYEK